MPIGRHSTRGAGARFRRLQVERLERRMALVGNASIAGTVWNDLDGNGQRGGDEPAEANIPVYLDANGNGAFDAGETQQTTAADGSYAFTNLDAGNYIVRHIPPPNYRITNPRVSGQRLFAVDTGTSPDRIVELNPTTGTELRSFAPPVANSFGGVGLAFDGQTLYFLSDSNDTLYELNPATGGVLDSTVLSSSTYGSLAALNGKVYVLSWITRVVSIFDPATNAVSAGYDLDTVNSSFSPVDALGNAAPTGELVVATSDAIAFVNPATGAKTSSFPFTGGFSISSIEVIGDEICVGYSSAIEVYNRTSRLLVRTVGLSFNPKGTAGWGDLSGASRVSLAAGQNLANVHFGNQYALVSISGRKVQDVNGDGVLVMDEPPLPGKTLYLDQNDNGRLDTGEPTTTTAADGSYVFSGLPVGKYVVRQEVAAGYQHTFPAISRKRLFVSDSFEGQIVELDPQSGALLNSFNAPLDSQIFHGLAFDGKAIYFLSNDNDRLYEVDPDSGAVVDSTLLPSGSYQELAALNGLVYIRVMNSALVMVFDPSTNAVVGNISISGLPSAYIYYGLGEMTGPDRLLIRSLQNDVYQVDPATGAATKMFTATTDNPYALTSVGQEIYVGTSGSSNGVIDVYSRSGTLLRSFNTANTPAAFALGGAQWTETGYRVTLFYGQDATGLDFGSTEPGQTNAAPTLDAIADPPAVLEDAGQQTTNLSGISAGTGESQTLTITAKSNNPALIPDPTVAYVSPGATASLKWAPSPDQFGSAVITVTARDNGGTAGGGVDTIQRTFTINVSPVNDPPRFTAGGDTAGDDTAYKTGVTIANWAKSISPGPANEQGQALAPNPPHGFWLSPDDGSLFLVPPTVDVATGDLTFTPAPNAHGTAIVTVQLQDDGGTAGGGIDTSPTQAFTITINKPRPWHNVVHALDVTNSGGTGLDGQVVAGDALAIINYINLHPGVSRIPPNTYATMMFLDTVDAEGGFTGDDFVVPGDALAVINWINLNGPGKSGPEGEFSSGSRAIAGPVPDDLTALLANDLESLTKRRRT